MNDVDPLPPEGGVHASDPELGEKVAGRGSKLDLGLRGWQDPFGFGYQESLVPKRWSNMPGQEMSRRDSLQ